MSTSSLKSATRRTSTGGAEDSSSTSSTSCSSTSTTNYAHGTTNNAQRTTNKVHRRARSLSRFSPRLPGPETEYNTPRGKFVNTKRGLGFSDDLELEFHSSPQEKSGEMREGRSARRSGEVGRFASDTASSRRRGRSVSRGNGGENLKDGKSSSSNNSRGRVVEANSRRRSLSVVRYQVSDSESDADLSQRFRHQGKVKNLNDKTQLTTSMTQAAPNGRQLGRSLSQKDLSLFRYGYSSDKSKQDLPAKIDLEEQQARDLSKIMKELISSSKSSAASQKPGWTKKRSNDKNRLSKQLGDEAEKYFENFASNVEDTDISSFDGERSDASSTIGGTINEIDGTVRVEAQSYQSPADSICHPTGTDGVILPWLQWETSNDSSLSGKSIRQPLGTPKALEGNLDSDTMTLMHDPSSNSKSSIGSSSPGLFDVYLKTTMEDNSRRNFNDSGEHKRSHFDMEEYRQLQIKEELLFERYKERQRIDCGGLLLCAGTY